MRGQDRRYSVRRRIEQVVDNLGFSNSTNWALGSCATMSMMDPQEWQVISDPKRQERNMQLYEVVVVRWKVDKTIGEVDKRIDVHGEPDVKFVAATSAEHAHTKGLMGFSYEEDETTELEVLVRRVGG